MDQVVGGGTGATAGVNRDSGDTEKEEILNHILLEQLLASLSETERQLIHMRYFQDKTQSEVAKYLGISQVQVSRMEKRILLRLRQEVG